MYFRGVWQHLGLVVIVRVHCPNGWTSRRPSYPYHQCVPWPDSHSGHPSHCHYSSHVVQPITTIRYIYNILLQFIFCLTIWDSILQYIFHVFFYTLIETSWCFSCVLIFKIRFVLGFATDELLTVPPTDWLPIMSRKISLARNFIK